MERTTIENRIETIDWPAVVVSLLLATIPTIALYFVLGMVLLMSGELGILLLGPLLLVGLAGFGWLLYHKPTHKRRIGATLFYLAIEAFAFPVAVFVMFLGLSATMDDGFGYALLGGIIGFILVGIVAWAVGGILYLVSRRFEQDTPETN